MSTEGYDDADDRRMREAQSAIVAALLPFTDNTPSWLLCLAVARVLRVLIRKAPTTMQKDILQTLGAYLRGNLEPPAGASSADSLLWTPNDERRN
jgi:hypothetical protein